MNDFDKFLDLRLRIMLDPVVATSAPPLKIRRRSALKSMLTVDVPIETGASGTAAPEAISALAPVVVTVPVAFPLL